MSKNKSIIVLLFILAGLIAISCKKEVIIDPKVDSENSEGTTIIIDQETNVNVDSNAEVNVDGEKGDREILERLCQGPVTISYLEVSKEDRSVYLEYKCKGERGSDHSDHDHDDDESCPDAEIK